jgi:Xaa-Pro aminopeptidase
MFSAETYKNRRQLLAHNVKEGFILICGNAHVPRNYPANTFRFRQDSNFLYFAGIDLPGLMLGVDARTGVSILFADDVSVDDAIWTGPQPAMAEWAEKAGIDLVKPAMGIDEVLKTSEKVHYLPSYPFSRKIWLAEKLGKSIAEINNGHSLQLIQAIVIQRSVKSADEVAQIENALDIATSAFHIDAMRMAQPGVMEYEIAGHIESTMLKNNCTSAYGIICSVRGEILHNEYYNNKLEKEQMLLIDAGAENPMHYASDITRTTPVGGKFSDRQKSVYNIVLKALNDSIDEIRPGAAYRDIHMNAAKIITAGLKDMGLMKGDIDEAVSQGAHALFFPHGLGHMIGLDVHDMEDLGENNVGYDQEIKRSKQFGTAFLRLGRKLEEGFVITTEPGIYFIPGLYNKWKAEQKHTDFINYTEVQKYLDFGGIRLEDNILVTASGSKVLGKPIPKNREEIESL